MRPPAAHHAIALSRDDDPEARFSLHELLALADVLPSVEHAHFATAVPALARPNWRVTHLERIHEKSDCQTCELEVRSIRRRSCAYLGFAVKLRRRTLIERRFKRSRGYGASCAQDLLAPQLTDNQSSATRDRHGACFPIYIGVTGATRSVFFDLRLELFAREFFRGAVMLVAHAGEFFIEFLAARRERMQLA